MVFNQFSMVFGGIARFALEGSRAGKLGCVGHGIESSFWLSCRLVRQNFT